MMTLDDAVALSRVMTWMAERNRPDDDDEPYFLQLAGPLSDGWKVEIVWAHHDGDIPVYEDIGRTITEAVNRMFTHITREPA